MSRFTSDRERRLWISALAVVIAIYATLGLAGRLAATLRDRGLLDISFLVAFVAVVAAIAGIGLSRRPKAREVWTALGIGAVYGAVLVRSGVSAEERTHLFEYGLVAVLIHQALVERRKHHRRVPVPAVLAVAITALLGWMDEGIQAFLPNRVYDLRDVFFNVVAALMAVGASLALSKARQGDSAAGETP